MVVMIRRFLRLKPWFPTPKAGGSSQDSQTVMITPIEIRHKIYGHLEGVPQPQDTGDDYDHPGYQPRRSVMGPDPLKQEDVFLAPPNFPPPSCVCAMEGGVSTSTFSAADSTSATVAATSKSVVVTGGGTDAWTSAPGEWKSEGILPNKVGRDHPMTCKCLLTMVIRKVPDWGSGTPSRWPLYSW